MFAILVSALLLSQQATVALSEPASASESSDTQEPAETQQRAKSRVSEALLLDGETAAAVADTVAAWGPHLSDAQVYDISHAIARQTRQHNLRAALVVALIKVESGYNTRAVSPTNDHGLMQLHGEPVYDIERNIALGCQELATWRATYDCGEREMLAHYNGGCRPPGVSLGYADRVLGLAEEVAE